MRAGNIMEKGDLFRLILSIIICQMAGIIGSALTAGSIAEWYPTLAKPSFTPPGSTIGLIWIILFTLMGVSLFFVGGNSQKSGSKNRSAFLCSPVHSQCSMECGFLHAAIPGQWSLGYCRFMDLDSHNYCEILAHKQDGGAIARALYNLGKRCSLLELFPLEIEPLK